MLKDLVAILLAHSGLISGRGIRFFGLSWQKLEVVFFRKCGTLNTDPHLQDSLIIRTLNPNPKPEYK